MARGDVLASPFKPVTLSSIDTKQLRAVAKTILDANLHRYRRFMDVDEGRVDPNEWKLVRTKDQVEVYLERPRRKAFLPFKSTRSPFSQLCSRYCASDQPRDARRRYAWRCHPRRLQRPQPRCSPLDSSDADTSGPFQVCRCKVDGAGCATEIHGASQESRLRVRRSHRHPASAQRRARRLPTSALGGHPRSAQTAWKSSSSSIGVLVLPPSDGQFSVRLHLRDDGTYERQNSASSAAAFRQYTAFDVQEGSIS